MAMGPLFRDGIVLVATSRDHVVMVIVADKTKRHIHEKPVVRLNQISSLVIPLLAL